MDLDEIPQSQTDNFPAGVSEEVFDTFAEASAFYLGLHYADDCDVYSSTRFMRNGQWVIRVKIGNF